MLREYNKSATDISRIYTYSYLTEEPSMGYLRRPIDPYDKAPTSPHFHRPTCEWLRPVSPKNFSWMFFFLSAQNSVRSSFGAGGKNRYGSKSAMKVLVDSIRSETPRPKSPHMNNEEPIELAHYPAAKPPKPGEPPKIERDDFPAPPYPYTDPGQFYYLLNSFRVNCSQCCLFWKNLIQTLVITSFDAMLTHALRSSRLFIW